MFDAERTERAKVIPARQRALCHSIEIAVGSDKNRDRELSRGYLQMYIYRLKKANRDERLGIQEKGYPDLPEAKRWTEEMFHLHDGR